MEVVLRPVAERFIREVVFPSFERGVIDAAAGLELLVEALADGPARAPLETLLDAGVEGTFFSLEESAWMQSVYRLLFHEWKETSEGWQLGAPYSAYAGEFEQTLHLCLMLEDPDYPYASAQASAQARELFLKLPDPRFGLSAFLCGRWEPLPSFPPDQVLSTLGGTVYSPETGLVIADWAWRSVHTVNSWGAQLPNRLSMLLAKEKKRLLPLEAPEAPELLEYWLGRIAEPPPLAVTFSGLGPTADTWLRELGAVARLIRQASAQDRGLTVMLSRGGRAMAEGAPKSSND